MMDHSVKMEKPSLHDSLIAGAVMALSYFLGGLLPMLPYFFTANVLHGLLASVVITFFLLIAFGYVKATVTGCGKEAAVRSAWQTLLVGAVASGCSFGIVWGLNNGFTDRGGEAVDSHPKRL